MDRKSILLLSSHVQTCSRNLRKIVMPTLIDSNVLLGGFVLNKTCSTKIIHDRILVDQISAQVNPLYRTSIKEQD